MPKRGRYRKKSRTHVVENTAVQSALTTRKDELKVPKSLVIRRGRTAPEVGELVHDVRFMMMPYTALHFQENPKNRKLTLAQYTTHLALPMGITHIFSFTQNDEKLNLKVARTPDGPTLSFRVHSFSLNKHIKVLQKRPINARAPSMTCNPPIIVTNNFGDHTAEPHIKLLRITFQNLFPQINVSTVKLNDCRRVILFNLIATDVEEKDTDGNSIIKKKQLVHVRQYAIKATPVGINRRVRRLVQAKLPNLNKVQDIADYIQGQSGAISDAPSDSEAEDDPSHVVKLPDNYAGRGNNQSQSSALKLIEMGPRLSLELIKVEKGLGTGDVLYHAYIQKTPQEVMELKRRKEQEMALKQQRKSVQQANVERKKQVQDEKRQKKRQKLENKQQKGTINNNDEDDDDNDNSDQSDENSSSEEEDDDVE